MLIAGVSALIISIIGVDGDTGFVTSNFVAYLELIGVTEFWIQLLLLWFVSPILFIGAIAIIITTAAGVAIFIVNLSEALPKTNKPPKTSLIKKLYKDLKNKVCSPVEYIK